MEGQRTLHRCFQKLKMLQISSPVLEVQLWKSDSSTYCTSSLLQNWSWVKVMQWQMICKTLSTSLGLRCFAVTEMQHDAFHIRRVKETATDLCSLLLMHNMCILLNSACFREECWERVLTWHGESVSLATPLYTARVSPWTRSIQLRTSRLT